MDVRHFHVEKIVLLRCLSLDVRRHFPFQTPFCPTRLFVCATVCAIVGSRGDKHHLR